MNIVDLENNFFGRKSIIDLLKRRVIDLKDGYRQNIAFLGNRFIGKSSILQRFIADLDDNDIVVIYLDLEDTNFDQLFFKFAGSILYYFSSLQNLPLHEDINLLMESARNLIPQTVDAIKKIRANISRGKIAESYRDLITLPEIFTIESGKFCVIVVDEFHCLEDFTIPDAFQELGKKIMTQKRCIYIVTSSLVGAAKEILSEKLSLLFGHFEMVNIEPFDLKTSREFLEHSLNDLRMSRYLKNFLIDFTGGHPLYLNIISQELRNLGAIHRQDEIFLPLLTQASENTIFSKWGVLSRHFELVLNNLAVGKGYQHTTDILISLSNGKHKINEIIEDTGLKKKEISQKLNRLIDLGVIIKNGTFYHYQDKLMKYWVKYVLRRRVRAIHNDPDRQRRCFRDEFTYLFDNFQIVSRKDLPARIVELLECFENEAFNLYGKKYRLPLFREVIPLSQEEKTQSDFAMIRAMSDDGIWFIILKEGEIRENDVNVFLEESRKVKQKLKKRVIISLADLEANARLKALQEKIWIWSEGEVNALLNLYDKPYIIK